MIHGPPWADNVFLAPGLPQLPAGEETHNRAVRQQGGPPPPRGNPTRVHHRAAPRSPVAGREKEGGGEGAGKGRTAEPGAEGRGSHQQRHNPELAESSGMVVEAQPGVRVAQAHGVSCLPLSPSGSPACRLRFSTLSPWFPSSVSCSQGDGKPISRAGSRSSWPVISESRGRPTLTKADEVRESVV